MSHGGPKGWPVIVNYRRHVRAAGNVALSDRERRRERWLAGQLFDAMPARAQQVAAEVLADVALELSRQPNLDPSGRSTLRRLARSRPAPDESAA